MELVLTDGKVLEQLAKTDKSLWEKIRDWFFDIIGQIRRSYESLNQSSKTAQVLKETVDSLDEIEQLFYEGVTEAGERTRTAGVETETQTERGKVYSFTPADFEKPITLHDIEVLRSIGRKSINAFTSEDIEKAQKWAYKFYKEQNLGIKSPFFRAWFGDWRVYDRNPVNIVKEKSDTRGKKVNKDTGWEINRSAKISGEKHSSSASVSGYLFMPYIDGIIENAVLLDSIVSNDDNINSIMFHSMYAVVNDGSENHILKLTVEELKNPGKDTERRAYKLIDIEKYQPSAQGSPRLTSSLKTDTEISIADLFAFVKQYDKNFSPKPVNEMMLNENKEPRVFYHGTRKENGEFWEFDYNKAKRKGGLGFKSFGQGNYFTSQKLTGTEMYGSRVISAYLHIENPAIIQMGKGEQFRNKVSELLGINAEQMTYPEIQKEMRRKGIDGVVALDEGGDVAIAVTFDSTQIKSATDNIGTFDGTNPNIRYSIDDTPETPDVSDSAATDRNLLLAMAEQLVGSEEENRILTNYKTIYDTQRSRQARLDELTDEMREQQSMLFSGISTVRIGWWRARPAIDASLPFRRQDRGSFHRARIPEKSQNFPKKLFKNLLTNPTACAIISPLSRTTPTNGGIAQLGERLNGIQEVRGSTPLISTKTKSLVTQGFFHFSIPINHFLVQPQRTKVRISAPWFFVLIPLVETKS